MGEGDTQMKSIQIGLGLLVTLIVGVIVTFVYFSFIDRDPPITFYESFGLDAASVKKDTFRAGDIFYAHRAFVQLREVEGVVSRVIVSADQQHRVLVREAIVSESYPVGPHSSDFAVAIPIWVPPGAYIYEVSIAYSLVWFARPVVVALPPVYFRIVP